MKIERQCENTHQSENKHNKLLIKIPDYILECHTPKPRRLAGLRLSNMKSRRSILTGETMKTYSEFVKR